MEIAAYLLYLALVPTSLLLTHVARRDLVSVVGAILTALYASLGVVDLAVVSALTVVLFSLSKIALARPLKDRRVMSMKVKYILVALTILSSSIPIAYIALGASISLTPLESQPLAIVTAASLYSVLAISIASRLEFLVNLELWRKLEVEFLESVFWRLGVALSGIAMLTNVVVHGVLGFLLMTAYLTLFSATTRLRAPLSKLLVSSMIGASAIITYLMGYT